MLMLAAVCLGVCGCAKDAPDEVLAPSPNGMSASEMAKPGKTPLIQIKIPVATGQNPAEVPPLFYVTWVALDIKSVRWIIVDTERFGGSWTLTEEYIQNNPDAPEWSDWVRYKADKEQGTMYESPPMDYGAYVFSVQAQSPRHDQTDLVLGVNMVRLHVSQRVTGPIFKVFNRYIGTFVTSSPSTPTRVIDIPSGVPMSFVLTASAEAYGAIVSGYRYGWDVTDPDDDSAWPMGFVPFVSDVAEVPPQSFSSGAHTFCTEVIDCWGYKSRASVEVNIVPAEMTRPLLVVDDWAENSPGWEATNGGVPSDAEHDQFWLAMTSGVEGFDPNTDVIEANSGNIPPLVQNSAAPTAAATASRREPSTTRVAKIAADAASGASSNGATRS